MIKDERAAASSPELGKADFMRNGRKCWLWCGSLRKTRGQTGGDRGPADIPDIDDRLL
jgi:hypothetical protein